MNSLTHTDWIDVHVHCVPPAYRKALQDANLGPRIRIPEWTPQAALGFMDEMGIAASVLSLSVPGTHFGDDGAARDLARRINVELADVVAGNSRRFGAFSTLPLPDVEGACREAEHALDELGLDGVGLLASYGEKYLGAPEFEPLMHVLNQRRAVVLIHPNNHPSTERVRLNVPNFLVEYLFDTTRAAVNLVFSGVLDRYPDIRFILPHSGGTLPFVSWRIAEIATRQLQVEPFSTHYTIPLIQEGLGQISLEAIQSRLRRFYYDTALSAGDAPMAATARVAAEDHVLFGSDWPYCSPPMAGDMMGGIMSDAKSAGLDVESVRCGGARKLFPRFA